MTTSAKSVLEVIFNIDINNANTQNNIYGSATITVTVQFQWFIQ